MEVSLIQMLGVVVFAALIIYDQMNTQLLVIGGKVIAGFGVGLILGDPVTGLAVGAVLELMSLGVGAYGGASVPDYWLGAITGTMVAIMSGKGADFGVLVGVPLSVLAIQLDVLVRTATTFFVHRAKAATDRGDVKTAYRWLWNGYTFWFLKYIVPVALLFAIGADAMTAFVNWVPQWFVAGFSIAGGLLPVVGIAILLRFMNTRAHLPFLIFGFALVSYLKVPMVGVAIFGLAAAILIFRVANQRNKPEASAPASNNQPALSTVGVNDDEL